MTILKASETRIPPDAFSRVAYQGKRIRVVRRGGKPVYLVSEEDMELLEQLEDRYWFEEGQKALQEFKKSGKKSVPWSKLRKGRGK